MEGAEAAGFGADEEFVLGEGGGGEGEGFLGGFGGVVEGVGFDGMAVGGAEEGEVAVAGGGVEGGVVGGEGEAGLQGDLSWAKRFQRGLPVARSRARTCPLRTGQ